jgi:beta-glucosidase
MVDGCRERGLDPIVTVVHLTVSRWLLHDSGWAGPKAGDRIARFAEFALPALCDAEFVATVNEANLMATFTRTPKPRLAGRGEVARRNGLSGVRE